MDSRSGKKKIEIFTGKQYGDDDKRSEPYRYHILIDALNGKLIIEDDDENSFYLESKERRWTVINKDKSKVVLDKKDITIESEDSITLKTNQLNMIQNTHQVQTAANKTESVGGNLEQTVAGNTTMTFNDAATITVGNATVLNLQGAVTLSTKALSYTCSSSSVCKSSKWKIYGDISTN